MLDLMMTLDFLELDLRVRRGTRWVLLHVQRRVTEKSMLCKLSTIITAVNQVQHTVGACTIGMLIAAADTPMARDHMV